WPSTKSTALSPLVSRNCTAYYQSHVDHRRLHSFPTRRSSDLLERDDVKLSFVHRAVGGITQYDIQLAAASNATIIGELNVVLREDRKSTRLNSSHSQISYAVFCLKKKK